ncbi:MAG: lipase maturation factor family protein, partial [Elusimicrobia bacterium]|nr:lipase maturation factor family protein [Elusimicrobiota bacterium]
LAAYRRVPGFAAASEWGYARVAAHRALFSRLTRLLWGDQLNPPTFHLGRWLFLKGLALSYLAAFVSYALQARGLVGPRGIMPAGEFLARAARALGPARWLDVPTVFWLVGTSGAALTGVAWAGAALSLLLLAGLAPVLVCFLVWALYLSVYSTGGIFLGYQWDILLLEAGFLAVLAAPWGLRPRLAEERAPSKTALWLLRWLWFRLIFTSGVVKLTSGDPTWRSLDALRYHFQTQPLPTPLAWYAHHLPASLLRASCAGTFVVELLLPFGVLLPRRPRLLCVLGVDALMLTIGLTGNYTFFNLLAVSLGFLLVDDAVLSGLVPALRRALGAAGGRPAEA